MTLIYNIYICVYIYREFHYSPGNSIETTLSMNWRAVHGGFATTSRTSIYIIASVYIGLYLNKDTSQFDPLQPQSSQPGPGGLPDLNYMPNH